MQRAQHSLADLAQTLGARLIGDGGACVYALAALDSAGPGTLTHLSSAAWRDHLHATRATAVLVAEADAHLCPTNALVVRNPYLAYARASALFDVTPAAPAGVDPSASVAPSATVDRSASVGANAVIGSGAVIAAGVSVGPGVVVGADVSIGAQSQIFANATLAHGVRLGARVRIHSGAVIGADGFGFTPDENGQFVRIHQTGSVRIGDDVDIGANTTIDRGAIDDTVIGNGVKIDNLVQIGHNCQIGEHTLICGCTGIVGSTRIGAHCVLAGGVGVGGTAPITICDGVMVSGMSHITASIDTPGTWSSGSIEQPHTRWKRNALRLRDLDTLFRRVGALERDLAAARATSDTPDRHG